MPPNKRERGAETRAVDCTSARELSNLLEIIVGIAPLLGLVGTIIGMITVFLVIFMVIVWWIFRTGYRLKS